MSLQVRAEATRQRIIDAAVELFGKAGYGNTALGDILSLAGVTKGAFYYHFPSKEAVATAIIDRAETQKYDAIVRLTSSSAPALESIIELTFVVAEMIESDNIAWVGNQLEQALAQVSPTGAQAFTQFSSVYVSVVAQAIVEGDLVDDLDAEDMTQTIWAAVLGAQLLADAIGDDLVARLAHVWKVVLRGIVAPPKLLYFQQFTARRAQHHHDRDGRASAARLPPSASVDPH